VAAAVVILLVGTRLTAVADVLAERTGLGEAVVGAIFLGATSLSGIVTSVTAAGDGRAELAVSNAVGGNAAQTVFPAVADAAYRRANLDHAAASPANLAQGALLVTLLAVPLPWPGWTWTDWWIANGKALTQLFGGWCSHRLARSFAKTSSHLALRQFRITKSRSAQMPELLYSALA